MKHLLHFGLQRSGTNFLETLLLRNFRVRLHNDNSDRKHPRQKHFRLYAEKRFIPEPQYHNDRTFGSFAEYEQALNLKVPLTGVAVISKDPYSWWLSYNAWARKCQWPKPGYHYLEEYNRFYGQWLKFARQDVRIRFVRYEDLLLQGERELNRLQEAWNLQPSGRRRIVRVSTVAQSGRFGPNRLQHYRDRAYMREISDADLQTIRAHLDHALLKALGYA